MVWVSQLPDISQRTKRYANNALLGHNLICLLDPTTHNQIVGLFRTGVAPNRLSDASAPSGGLHSAERLRVLSPPTENPPRLPPN